jgi:dihydrofolate reductase
MAKIIAFTNLTLDGIMQAPGRPDEDTRGGFKHGGWAAPYAAMSEAGDALGNVGACLFGRRTYEDFYAIWPNQTASPFSDYFNNIQKYVASTTLHEPLPWQNSTLLKGDFSNAITLLKEELSKDIVIFGSGVLIQSLMRYDLVDKFVLFIHPLVLGTGRRLFTDDGELATLRLVASKVTTSGVVIASYEPVIH